jgi:DNA-binding MarR family transcriptional regulator
VGTALTAIALFLLSTLTENTSTTLLNVYFLVLGLGLGGVLQVLILAVQNAVPYEDLGAATAGSTFFRQIGGSFGTAVFGAIFANQLTGNLRDALSGVRLPPGFNPAEAQGNPDAIKHLPAAVHQGIIHAYSESISTVFLVAAPIALVAFILAWFIKETPLRDSVARQDPGEGYGAAPSSRTSVQEVEAALARLTGGQPRGDLYRGLAERANLDVTPGGGWVLTWLARNGPVVGTDLADAAGVTVEYGRPYVDRLVEQGYVRRDGDTIVLTDPGQEAADKLFEARRGMLADVLADYSPEQHAELAAMLNRLARASVGDDDDRELLTH